MLNRKHRRVPVVVSLLGALLLAGCGSDSGDAVDSMAAPTDVPMASADPMASKDPTPGVAAGERAAPDAVQGAGLPDLEVVRVGSGEKAQLRSLAVAGKPTLLWFWAPHCPICIAEAPELIKFAEEHGDHVHILGLGAQDDLAMAGRFLADTGTGDLEMVWDRSGKSWVHFGVTSQPTVVVLSPEGKVVRTWFRKFDVAGILRAAVA